MAAEHNAYSRFLTKYGSGISPKADIPVIQVSINPFISPKYQYGIGEALKGIELEDILVIGSGNTVHNFNWFDQNAQEPKKEAVVFDDWVIGNLRNWDIEALNQYLELAPFAKQAVPRPEHFMSLFIAMGSGTVDGNPDIVYRDYELGAMSNMCIEF